MMRLPGELGYLTYCLNIHPTQTWAEAREAIRGPLRGVKAALCPDEPFAAGLRFSAEAVRELQHPQARAELKELLAAQQLLPVTVNGFPYGRFHGAPVKEDVTVAAAFSIATSVPVPVATPTSAGGNAGASFMPSPPWQ